MKKKRTKRQCIIYGTTILIFVFQMIRISFFDTKINTEDVMLDACVDGDTAKFIIGDDVRTVRFLAIDTPETKKPNTPVQAYGPEASEFTCRELTNAKSLRLEYEEKNKTDKYGRELAWIFVDDILLQQQLVANGLAKVAYIYGDYKYTEDLYEAQKGAKNQQLGIWSAK